MVPCVGLQCVIVVFPDHTHFFVSAFAARRCDMCQNMMCWYVCAFVVWITDIFKINKKLYFCIKIEKYVLTLYNLVLRWNMFILFAGCNHDRYYMTL